MKDCPRCSNVAMDAITAQRLVQKHGARVTYGAETIVEVQTVDATVSSDAGLSDVIAWSEVSRSRSFVDAVAQAAHKLGWTL